MGADDLGVGVHQVVVAARVNVHDLVECVPVSVRVPNLERRLARRHEVGRIVREVRQLLRKIVLSSLLEHQRDRVHEQLDGGESLLAVDEVPRGQVVDAGRLRLEDHGAKEVGRPGALRG